MFRAAVLLVFGFVSTANAVAPQRTFVASSGNDASPCSVSAPCRGFQAAIDAVGAGGEVVALDSAGYGAMAIHKSVSVIVPSGIHAGLSPSAGIPLPGFPGASTVVLVDIQDADVVVLRGLNINHQGTVTGGIDWLSAHGGTLHIENTTINGFPNEGLLMGTRAGKLFVKDSIFRNNGYGVYLRSSQTSTPLESYFSADRIRIENSIWGLTVEGAVRADVNESLIRNHESGIVRSNNALGHGYVSVNRCVISGNEVGISLRSLTADFSAIALSATTVTANGTDLSPDGVIEVWSLGNNSTASPMFFNHVFPVQ